MRLFFLKFPFKMFITFLLIGALLFVGVITYIASHDESQQLTVEYVTIPVSGLPSAFDGFRMVQMSDFHLYPLTKPELVQRAVKISNELEPDLVVLTGDYVWHEVEAIHDLLPILADLRAPFGVYSIMGNHELWTDPNEVKTAFEEQDMPLLINQGVTLRRGDEHIFLVGLDDGWSGHPDLEAALVNAESGETVILLYHEPDLADQIAQDGRVAVQLSGHSHGGQVQFPNSGPLLTPYLSWKYPQGLYRVDDLWLYTNRGIGVTNIPWRYNCPPEITLITLTRQ
jgi:predicted MPP superfamily phosphohydrolase